MRRFIPVLALLLAASGCELLQTAATTPPPSQPGGGTTKPPSGGKTQIVLSSVNARPGQTVKVTATLNTGGARVAGTQNDIGFDPRQIAIARKSNGKPDCAANGAIGKEGTAFSFQPPGCSGAACTGIRALVLSLSSVDPIANGSVLYTCTVQVAAGASAGRQPLRLSKVGFSDPAGKALGGGGSDGSVTVAK